MKVRYSKQAMRQIESALSYVQARSMSGAEKIGRRVEAVAVLIGTRPSLGRPTSRPGIRRISLLPHPYTMDYKVVRDEIVVLRFRHTGRKPLK